MSEVLPGVESSQAQVNRLLPLTFWIILFFIVKLFATTREGKEFETFSTELIYFIA
jgi:hypothetical protein